MLRWNTLIRTGTNVRRSDRKNLFYPIFVREDGKAIHSVGEPYYGTNLNEVQAPEGYELLKEPIKFKIDNQNNNSVITIEVKNNKSIK